MKKIFTLCVITLCSISLFANDISVSNVALGTKNAGNRTIDFDIAWKNSWRTSTNEANYDGAWVFIKFRKTTTSLWQHATLNYMAASSATAQGHTEPTGSIIKVSADSKGTFIYRDADGLGDVSFTGAKLRWNYAADGVLDTDLVEVKVFAVEMVYIPQGAFAIGSGGAESYPFRDGATNIPYNVANENAITVGSAAGNLSPNLVVAAGAIPAAYPKGYNAFWQMKYEVSSQQYIDFLNNIDLAKATRRGVAVLGFTGTHPNTTITTAERAATGINGQDLLSLLDWSALRPMTELEYEKSCRGANITPIANEYVWGNTTITNVATPSSQGLPNETWATGNCAFFIGSPIRCGALATATSTRASSGAGYYGSMELAGNVWEYAITASNAGGRAFTGNHGDGNLTADGDYDVANWPAYASQAGAGIRGGSYNINSPIHSRTSDRGYADYPTGGTTRGPGYGGRGVRTAE